jgi:Leucine-rich repeat (LRR) protein
MNSEAHFTQTTSDKKARKLLRQRSRTMAIDKKERRLLRAAPQTGHDIEYGDNNSFSDDDDDAQGRNVRWSLTTDDRMNDALKNLSDHHIDRSTSKREHLSDGSDEDFERSMGIYKDDAAISSKTYFPKTKQGQGHHCKWLNRCLTMVAVLTTLGGVALGGYVAGRYVTQNEQQVKTAAPDATVTDAAPDATVTMSSSETDSTSQGSMKGPKAPNQIDTTGMTRIEKMYYAVGHLSDTNFLSHNFTMARTPQEHALDWLATLDPNEIAVDDAQMAERYGLLVMYFALNGDSWSDGTNWLIQKDICSWSGVSCEVRSVVSGEPPKRVVTSVDLSSRQLKGFIPNEIAALSELEHLALHDNPGLNQELPEWIGNLSKLKTLQIYDTGLSGTVPSTIGNLRSLEEMYLHRNFLQGDIPQEITKLTNLQEMLLYKNRLTGPIPVDIGRLTNLKRVWLSDNVLTGGLPASMGNMASLRALYADHNRLNGPLPGFLANAKDLTDIRLTNNAFVGEIPEEWISLSNLYILYLDHNNLNGNIPEWIGGFPNLQFLQLEYNGFTGLIPNGLSRSANLHVLDLSSNQLSGGIPPGLGSLSKLEALMLHGNNLEGYVPTSLSSLKHLKKLNVSQNTKITGSVPMQICALGIKEIQVDCTVSCSCCTPCYQPDQENHKDGVITVDLGQSHNNGS